jgi:hypothetical protein
MLYQLLMTPEGKKLQVSLEKDATLYVAPHNPPNTGTAYTSGTDLYCHKARSGKVYFYTYFWSMWQGVEDSYQLISEDEAKTFVLQKATQSGYVGEGVQTSTCESIWGEELFREDA